MPATHAVETETQGAFRRMGRVSRPWDVLRLLEDAGGILDVPMHVVPLRALPGEQEQTEAPKLLVVPGGQAVHTASPALLYVVGPQTIRASAVEWARRELGPASGSAEVRPLVFAYLCRPARPRCRS